MKTVLFVDDEPHILGALKRGLRRRRKEWNILFASEGDEALEIVNSQSVDALVSDMRMPRMHGAELVRKVRLKKPSVIRIGLSGYSEAEQLLSSCDSFHQFWGKPCAVDEITTKLRFLFQVGDRLCPELRARLCAIDSLPIAQSVLKAFRVEAGRPELDIEVLTGQICSDLGLYCRVSKLFNTSFLGAPRRVENSSDLLLSIDWLVKILAADETALSDATATPLTPVPASLPPLAYRLAELDGVDSKLQRQIWTAAHLTQLNAHLEPLLDLTDTSVLDDCSAYLAALWGFPSRVVEALSSAPPEDNQVKYYLSLSVGALGLEPSSTRCFHQWNSERGGIAQDLLVEIEAACDQERPHVRKAIL